MSIDLDQWEREATLAKRSFEKSDIPAVNSDRILALIERVREVEAKFEMRRWKNIGELEQRIAKLEAALNSIISAKGFAKSELVKIASEALEDKS